MEFTTEVLRRKVMEGAWANELLPCPNLVTISRILISMSSLPPQTRYVCNRCIQRLSCRNVSSISGSGSVQVLPAKPRATRRNNGLTWEGMRFRKVKLEEKSKWDASNILVGKEARFVPVGPPPTPRVLPDFKDPKSPEVSRPPGRVRAGRARIPGPRATEYLKSKEQLSKDLVPSAPSTPLGIREKPIKPVEGDPVLPTSETMSPHNFNWYWETMPPKTSDITRANDFFLKNRNPPQFLRSAARFREVPESDVPEVAFVGRSNVGKSSLLNAVVDANVKDLLARTSAIRGFTKTMNFFGIGPETGVMLQKQKNGREKIVGSGLVIVDMPGYGDGSLSSWGVEIMKYIQSRKQLRRVFVLLDAEHGIKDKDRSLLASLRLAGVSHQIILSKMDKIYLPPSKHIMQLQKTKRNRLKPKGTVEELRETMKKLRPEINPPVGGGALGEILACSSEVLVDRRRLGLDHVRYGVLKAVGLDKPPKKTQLHADVGNSDGGKEKHSAIRATPLLKRL
jgi:GTP-binding protein